MSTLLIEPHYLGSLEYFTQVVKSESLILEINQHFTKQTFKSRCVILTVNGVKQLSIPVKFGNRTPFKDVRIDHTQSWKKDHWGSFYSSYGKAPFFEYFAEEFQSVWAKRQEFLLDLTCDMMTLCLQLLQIDRPIELTEVYDNEPKESLLDLRELIVPKSNYTNRTFYQAETYTQVFGNKFVPNLSIVDLIMNEGGNALNILKKSELA